MGFVDELKKLAHPYAEDEEVFDELQKEEQPAPKASRPILRRASAELSSDEPAFERRHGSARLVSLGASKTQVVLTKPDRFNQVSDIAAHLKENKAVVLNLETTEKDVARRIVDFMSGSAFALGGQMRRVAACTYLVIPENMDLVSEDIMAELGSNEHEE